MRHLGKAIREFLEQEEGPTAVEYAVMLALIIVIAFAAITLVGTTSSANFNGPKLQGALQSSS